MFKIIKKAPVPNPVPKKTVKIIKRAPSIRQRVAIKHLVEKGGSVADAMRAANYSEGTIKNPKHLTQSKGFIGVLESVGLDDKWLADGYRKLAGIKEVKEMVFRDARQDNLVQILKDDPDYKEDSPKKQYRIETSYIPTDMKDVATAIKSLGGTIVFSHREGHSTVVKYTIPHHQALKSSLELSSKAKGAFAPEKHEIAIAQMSPEEEQEVQAALETLK